MDRYFALGAESRYVQSEQKASRSVVTRTRECAVGRDCLYCAATRRAMLRCYVECVRALPPPYTFLSDVPRILDTKHRSLWDTVCRVHQTNTVTLREEERLKNKSTEVYCSCLPARTVDNLTEIE